MASPFHLPAPDPSLAASQPPAPAGRLQPVASPPLPAPAAMPAGLPAPAAVLPVLLRLLPSGVVYYRPVYAGDGCTVADFRFDYLNAAAQRLLGLPAQPAATYLGQFPGSVASGAFAFHCAALAAGGEALVLEQFYQADGYDKLIRAQACRLEDGLLVSFTDAESQPRTAVEVALRQSQAAEQAARAEAEAQRQRFYDVLMQLPAQVAIYHGSDHIYQFVNPRYQRFFPHRSFAGRPLCEAIPEVTALGLAAKFDQVYQTGEPFYAQEMETWFDFRGTGEREQLFVNFYLHPLRDVQGRIDGVLDFSHDVTEQVRARQQRETQRRQFEELFAQAPVGIATFRGPRYVIEVANPTVCAYWGRTQAQAVGTPLFELLPEAAGQGFEQLLDGVLATGTPHVAHELPARIDRHGRREIVYWDFVYHPLREADGRISGVTVVATEVTEQVLARQQLEQLNRKLEARVAERTRELAEQQALLRQILGQAPAYIATFSGPELRFSFFNANYQRLLSGRARLGCTLAEVQPEAVGQGFPDLLRRIYASGEPAAFAEAPVWIDPLDSTLRQGYYDLNFLPLAPAPGQGQGVLVFGVDVTERVLARQEREAQRQRLREMFEQAPVAICVFAGPDYVLDVVNPRMLQMWGRPPAGLLGQPFFEALPELRGQGLPELLAEVRRSGQPFAAHEMAFRLAHHAADQVGFYDFVYEPLRDEQGQVVAVTCVATNVTERVLARRQVQALNDELTGANQALHQSNQRLQRTNADLDTFVYTASHDLKSPITNLEGLLAALRDTLPVEVQQQPLVGPLLRLLDDTVARFRLTIEQLTELIRLQQTPAGPAQQVLLGPLVAAVQQDLAAEAAAAQAQVHVAIADGLGLHFAPANVRSIVYNLLSNALKYRAPDRPAQVWVQAERQPGAVVLTVRDNGLGLSASQQQRLFQAFQRLHTHVEGTGVGLYMIKRLIENAGATIAVRSEVGVGSAFVVTFPG